MGRSKKPNISRKKSNGGLKTQEDTELKETLFDETKKSSESTPIRRLKPFEIFKFADKLDILFMVIGTIASVGTGIMLPLMMLVYKGVTASFVDLSVSPNSASTIIHRDVNSACIPRPVNSTVDIFLNIHGMIKGYLVLGCTSILCYWIGFSLWMTAAERQVRRIRFALFRSIMNQEIGWFDQLNPSELISRLIPDLDKIRDGLGDKRADFISLICRIFGGLIFALVTGWKLTLVFLVLSPLTVITFNITMRIMRNYTEKEMNAFSKASAVAQEVLSSIRTVTAFGGQKKEEKRFSENLIEAKQIGIKKGLYMGLCQGVAQITIYLSFAVTFWYGSYLVRTECQTYNGGTVIVVFMSCLMSTFSIAQIVPNIQAFAEAAGSAGYIFDVISRTSKIDAFTDDGEKPSAIIGDIELKNVSFTYPARQDAQILKNVNMKIPSGKTVALVGASGCGKSTTIQLMQRIYDPEQGQVLLDGKDIKTLNVAWLRSHIGIVSQEPVLFTGSIEENIRFGKQDATDDEIQNAAKMANAHDFIMALPENYKTSSGDKLIIGQKQRVAIARALVSDPKILLLDEATSALDNTSERVVQDALDKAKEGRTTIVIAHRLSTIRNADLIIALDKGEIIEYGTHNDLMDQKGLYYELVAAQQHKEKNENYNNDRYSNATYVKSKTYDDPNIDAIDNIETEIKSKRRFRLPFVFKILKLNSQEIVWIILGCLTSISFGAITPLFALYYSNIFGLFAEQDLHKAHIETRNYALIIFCIGIACGVCQCISNIAFSRSGEALTMRMRIISFASMLRQEIDWFDREENKIGILVTQLSSDTSNLQGLSGVRMGVIFNGVGGIICALIISFLAGWKLTLIVLLFTPLMIFSSILQGKRRNTAIKPNDKRVKNVLWAGKGGMFATEAIDNIRTVVGLHQEQYFISHYEECFNKDFRRSLIKIQLQSIGIAIANSLMFFIHAAAFGYGSVMIKNKEMNSILVFRVFAVITYGAMSIGRSTAMIPDYTKGKESAIRIFKLNNRQSKINPDDTKGVVLEHMTGNIQFEHVEFIYSSRPKFHVLKDLNLLVNASQTTALCGPSGSGKSTCAALLLRFYDPCKGTISLAGHDIRKLSLPWLRSQIGFVQQEPVLFNLSIRDNIAYGDNSRQVTQDEIEQAARNANIHDAIISFPQSYNTMCGTKGNQMSGGEKQRIAIARALIRDPKILLLDEATSALDIRSEKMVQDALDVAQNGRTCLTIAHRLATIQNADKIVVVDQGAIQESGTHDELMEQKGIFYKLNMAQERNDE